MLLDFNFSGGRVPVNTTLQLGSERVPLVFSNLTLYAMEQQGPTANITCKPLANFGDYQEISTSNSYTSIPIYANTSSVLFYLRQWNSTTNCLENSTSSSMQIYITQANAEDQVDTNSGGLLPTQIFPGANSTTRPYREFAIVSQGIDKYNFLTKTVREVIPLITRVMVWV
ncbi:hypothetical protein BV22DRAFT_654588 [Leucogyrophana mollusca]|uniref:Uncharacterized protein n=1 Tax=Leucogyrophana mollusca TaxID=85980 RepID=A0ACB8BAK0_9AGAM|nr:hypothetical protein BV22DRAFT_654588 [Leucogyrophana mollusca]